MPTARDFSAHRLQKLFGKFTQAGQRLDTQDAARLHSLRILAKKLRYSAEFFSTLYDRQRTKPFLAALSEVQEVLGQINDVAVAHRLLGDIAAMPELSTHQEAIALAKGWIAHDLSHQFTALRKAVQRFNKQPAFWGR